MKKYLGFIILFVVILQGCNSLLEKENEELKRQISILQKENRELTRMAEEKAAEAKMAMNKAYIAEQKAKEILKSCEEQLKKK